VLTETRGRKKVVIVIRKDDMMIAIIRSEGTKDGHIMEEDIINNPTLITRVIGNQNVPGRDITAKIVTDIKIKNIIEIIEGSSDSNSVMNKRVSQFQFLTKLAT